jgi:class 3 adenylate cyclase/predicted ATPase
VEFDQILAQVLYLLQREGRLSYRALKLRFNLDDDYIEALKDEIIDAKQQAIDENGKVLVWAGGPDTTPALAADPQAAAHLSSEALAKQPPASDLLSSERRQIPWAAQVPQAASPPVERGTPEAERRQLTVMFCDLVDSTSLARRLDPEDLREVIRAYQAACAEVIQHFDGHITQYLGDGLLVYYGYPRAHEDDAQRAIRTALGIVEAIGTLNARLERERGVRLFVRFGIHTGLVVVGEMGAGDRREQLALGETPNVAAKIQGLAAPDTVAISAVTYRLTQGYFVCQDLGRRIFKEGAAPVHMYRVLEEREVQSRWDIAVTAGLTPLVGREEEVDLLLQRWEQSKAGSGQVVLLRGEAGIGKSRLVEALRAQVGDENHTWITFRCSPYHTHSAFYAVIYSLQRFLQWRRDDTPTEKLAKLERMLQTSRHSPQEVVPLFAALLSVPLPDERYPAISLSPQRLRQRTQEALVTWLVEETERQPVLTVWEDLHWADPSTLELLSLLIDRTPTARMLTLLTFRPDFHPPWSSHSYRTQITPGRLGRHQIEQMVSHLTHGKALPVEVLEQVVAKTDGVPLFVEELIKTVLESGLVREAADGYMLTGPLPPLAIPATLQDSLMARLDRLGTAREVAQLGATLGREFSYEMIQAVSPMDEPTLQHELVQLVAAELLYQRGLPPRARYLFKHTLIQETAYQSLLKSTRQRYHQRIAQVLAAQFPETVETQPELLAHHYTEAGLSAQALPYWQRAGELAIRRSANLEAISHLTKGLEVLQTLPDTPERIQQELALQLALGAPLSMLKGHGAPEVEHLYTRARELCQQVGDSPQLFPVLLGLRRFYSNRAEFKTAHELGEQLLRLAQNLQDPVLLLQAHGVQEATLFHLGEFASVLTHLEQAIALYDPQKHRAHSLFHATDPVVLCLSYAAWALWFLGYPDQALHRSHEALTLAQQLSHAYTLGFALHTSAMLHKWRREPQRVQEQADAAIALSSKHGFVRWLGGGMIRRGWALAEQGAVEEGIEQLRQGLATWRAMGSDQALPHILAMLAEAYGHGGHAKEGQRVLDEALAAVHATAECHYEAELYRLKGELLLVQEGKRPQAKGPRQTLQEAEACFHQARTIARRQQAKSLELRAVMSLGRLWQHQDKRVAARQMLAEIYDRFTEGFDTPDLQETQALLEALR